MICIWVIGTPLLFAYLVCRHRREILENKDRLLDPMLHGTKLLWLPYRREYWYWEAVEASRKIMPSFPVQLFKPGTATQPAFCLFVIAVYMVLGASCNPFSGRADNFLNIGLIWLLFAQFFAFLFSAAEVGSKLVIDIVLSTAIIGSVAFALAIIIWDFSQRACCYR